ncbi:MAG: hypothetical protein V1708_01630 [Candidatus Micrarchaeota archaeon]
MGLPMAISGMEVPKIVWIAVAIIVFGAIASQANSDLNNATYQAKSWMSPVVTKAESKALSWVVQNSLERDVFVTDIFGGEHIMGNTLREGTEGGDWAIVPDVVARMGKIDEFYKSKDPKQAHDIAVKYNASFVLMPDRQVFAGFGWYEPEKDKMQRPYFTQVYQDGGLTIYSVNKVA